MKKISRFSLFGLFAVVLLAFTLIAHAAPFTYTNDTTGATETSDTNAVKRVLTARSTESTIIFNDDSVIPASESRSSVHTSMVAAQSFAGHYSASVEGNVTLTAANLATGGAVLVLDTSTSASQITLPLSSTGVPEGAWVLAHIASGSEAMTWAKTGADTLVDDGVDSEDTDDFTKYQLANDHWLPVVTVASD